MAKVDKMGGAVAAIESGFMQEQIEDAAYRFQRAVDRGEREIVGVNTHVMETRRPWNCCRLTRSGGGAAGATGASACRTR